MCFPVPKLFVLKRDLECIQKLAIAALTHVDLMTITLLQIIRFNGVLKNGTIGPCWFFFVLKPNVGHQ